MKLKILFAIFLLGSLLAGCGTPTATSTELPPSTTTPTFAPPPTETPAPTESPTPTALVITPSIETETKFEVSYQNNWGAGVPADDLVPWKIYEPTHAITFQAPGGGVHTQFVCFFVPGWEEQTVPMIWELREGELVAQRTYEYLIVHGMNVTYEGIIRDEVFVEIWMDMSEKNNFGESIHPVVRVREIAKPIWWDTVHPPMATPLATSTP